MNDNVYIFSKSNPGSICKSLQIDGLQPIVSSQNEVNDLKEEIEELKDKLKTLKTRVALANYDLSKKKNEYNSEIESIMEEKDKEIAYLKKKIKKT